MRCRLRRWLFYGKGARLNGARDWWVFRFFGGVFRCFGWLSGVLEKWVEKSVRVGVLVFFWCFWGSFGGVSGGFFGLEFGGFGGDGVGS